MGSRANLLSQAVSASQLPNGQRGNYHTALSDASAHRLSASHLASTNPNRRSSFAQLTSSHASSRRPSISLLSGQPSSERGSSAASALSSKIRRMSVAVANVVGTSSPGRSTGSNLFARKQAVSPLMVMTSDGALNMDVAAPQDLKVGPARPIVVTVLSLLYIGTCITGLVLTKIPDSRLTNLWLYGLGIGLELVYLLLIYFPQNRLRGRSKALLYAAYTSLNMLVYFAFAVCYLIYANVSDRRNMTCAQNCSPNKDVCNLEVGLSMCTSDAVSKYIQERDQYAFGAHVLIGAIIMQSVTMHFAVSIMTDAIGKGLLFAKLKERFSN